MHCAHARTVYDMPLDLVFTSTIAFPNIHSDEHHNTHNNYCRSQEFSVVLEKLKQLLKLEEM